MNRGLTVLKQSSPIPNVMSLCSADVEKLRADRHSKAIACSSAELLQSVRKQKGKFFKYLGTGNGSKTQHDGYKRREHLLVCTPLVVNRFYVPYSIEVRELALSRSRPFVITRPSAVASTFRDWFPLIGMRQRGWNVCFPHSPAQCSSIFHRVTFIARMLRNSGVQVDNCFWLLLLLQQASIHFIIILFYNYITYTLQVGQR